MDALRSPPRWPLATLVRVLRRLQRGRLACKSETHLALLISLSWTLLYNPQFWHQTLASMWKANTGSAAFLASLFVLIVCTQAMLLLLMPTRMLMLVAASCLFLVAALSSYFTSAYGAIMSKDMLRNVLETDPAEVSGLLSGDLVFSMLVLGVLPALLVWRVSLPGIDWTGRARQRATFLAGTVSVCLLGLAAAPADYAVFLREHKPIRLTLAPAAPVVGVAGLLSHGPSASAQRPLLDPGGTSLRTLHANRRPLVMFVVVGETARAANFQLGGYRRATTPELHAMQNLVYLGPASSCGTSTAWSVPCMFSHLGHRGFDVDAASAYTNVLDALAQAGFDVEWRDNNSGCKGACARVSYVSYAHRPDRDLCRQAHCFDEVMLSDLTARLRRATRDTAIVFHQIGSHGPGYAERYPPAFERFRPACHSHELQECTAEEVVNAYDNTILYTDHVIARLIGVLRAAQNEVDAVLIFASDHGESLGEHGMYLHGVPYPFAPQVQKEVPMLLWTSPAYDARVGLRQDCMQRRAADGGFSHDNLYHTILGAAGVSNQVYQPRLDILSGCKAEAART